MRRLLSLVVGLALLVTVAPIGQTQEPSAPPASTVLNGGFELYADNFGPEDDQNRGSADEALLWSQGDHVENSAEFRTDGDDDSDDYELVVSPCSVQDDCSSHQAWQSVTYAHGWALPANFQHYQFTIEDGAEHVADARNPRVNLLVAIGPSLGVLQMTIPDDVTNGVVELDPRDASAKCAIDPTGACAEWSGAWDDGDETQREGLLSQAHLIQHGFWDLNRQDRNPNADSGQIVIDDVAIDYAPDVLG